MWPSEVPSDLDVEEVPHDELVGRWSILLDLHSEFQGATGAYAVFAFLVPALFIVAGIFGWGMAKDNPALAFVIAAIIFVGFVSVSLYSWVWCRWTSKRIKRVEKQMQLH